MEGLRKKMGTIMNGIGKVIIYIMAVLMLLGAFALFLQSRDIKYLTEKSAKLEYRIEILEMERTTNKLLLKMTQRLVVPNERALKEIIK